MNIILPIMKKWSDLIFKGQKKYELRKKLPEGVSKIYVYESRGSGKVIGELKIKALHHLPLDDLWNLVKDGACVEEEFFRKYYEGKEEGVAVEIKSATLYPEPLPLSSFSLTAPPQNYCIIKSGN